MKTPFDSELEARLLRYTAIDSQSDAASPSQPSTAIQLDMQRLLMAELEEIGVQDIALTDYGVVLATIPPRPKTPRCWACWPMSIPPPPSTPAA